MGDIRRNYNEVRMRNVVASGEHLQILETMLEMLAERFDTCSERDSAGLARQMQVVMDQIQEIRAQDSADADGFDDFVESLEID